MAMNEHTLRASQSDTPHLRSTTQNICFLISISPVHLKLMVKITSILGSYRFLRITWHDIFSLSDHFPAKLEFVYSLQSCRVEEQMLVFSSIQYPSSQSYLSERLLCVINLVRPTCAVQNLPQRTLSV